MRQIQVPLDSRVINAFHDLPIVINCEYTKFAENVTVKKQGEVFKTLTVQGSEWMNKESRVVSMIDFKPIARVQVKFLKCRLMPTTHTIIVFQARCILLYTIVNGLAIDVGKIIEKENQRVCNKEEKSTALLFPSLITGIYKASGVQFEASDERVKNKGAITARTVERIVVEYTVAATLKHHVAVKAEQATRIETMLHELSKSINACVQA